ncbi:pimeloyl-ACP methyl ester carboxylesterase [Sphingobium fontiphilum]|uniref:Pimeloyl-ACP methyl ester carboxylesterase n=1 Tax=Sphingobium fontiphilum TaxID=944425 RepID=A0A7W6DK16_9SPHN|nr:alpha/beta hydrolase [Sphingobium fontiphilum]MBB3982017.1 pimeloyl-ACP methyl ester carboxylesterase [Sphingobium fontiphilum]
MTTFVLLHGGGMGGWTWKYVREILEAKGHKVYTPTFTGFGEREHLIGRDVGNATHVRDIVNVFKYEDLRDVVLVAHSYAGTVAPGVIAEVGDRIASIIYLDAIVPRSGERIASLMGYVPEDQLAALDAMLEAGEGPIGSGVHEMQRAAAKEHPHLMDPAREKWLLDNLSDQPMKATACVIPVGAETITRPVDYIAAAVTVMTAMHDRARELGWTMHDHPGDHALLVGDPEGTTDLILKIAAGGAKA